MTRRVLVLGAAGFVGGHLVRRLKSEGAFVRGVDRHSPPFGGKLADEFLRGDLRESAFAVESVRGGFDEVYQLAADMGGAAYIFTGANDASIMSNSVRVNANILAASHVEPFGRVFFSSSACVYPVYNQQDPLAPNCEESSAYPAAPDSDYGWEKLFSERLFLAYARNHGLVVRIARYHNIFGPEGPWQGGREKAPAALCRKVALAAEGQSVEVWGDGSQTRSFLFIEEAIEGTVRLMRSDFVGPVNLGSTELVTVDQLANEIMRIAAKRRSIVHRSGPVGVRGRRSDNTLIRSQLGWEPSGTLSAGLEVTYRWIAEQIASGRN